MSIIPIITADTGLFERVSTVTRQAFGPDTETVLLATEAQAVDHLRTDLPELVLLSFGDANLDAFGLLEALGEDRWLIHGGIVGIQAGRGASERLVASQSANVIVALSESDTERQLPRVLEIIRDNRRILFQREIGADLVRDIAGAFELRNDPLEARCYVNLVCNFLYNAARIDSESRETLGLALYEILMNAIEHGNCGVSYERKSAWLEAGGDIVDLIRECCGDPEVAARRVTFEYAITDEVSRFTIADQGEGFDWRAVKDPTLDENLDAQHGRGIMLARAMTEELQYNEKGNEVRFEFRHPAEVDGATPSLLGHISPSEVKPGDVVFREGDAGNYLYYIAKGRFEVLVGGRAVSYLSPDDIFVGEMSFLLNNRRSATVRAVTDGRLIRISKADFVEAIKRKPHYALFLSRLLAQRVVRANERATGGPA